MLIFERIVQLYITNPIFQSTNMSIFHEQGGKEAAHLPKKQQGLSKSTKQSQKERRACVKGKQKEC